MISQGSSTPPYFLPFVIDSVPTDFGTRVQVRPVAGGDCETVSTHACRRVSPEWEAWHAAYDRYSRLGREIIAICQREGLVYAGPACQRLPEWEQHRSASAEVTRTGGAAIALHPYRSAR